MRGRERWKLLRRIDMKKMYLRKRVLTCMTAAILAASAGFVGSGLSAQAASYIKSDNTIIRDAANGNMIGGINQGTEVEIVESKTGTDGMTWHHVRYAANGTTAEGWVRSDLIADNGTTAEGTDGNDGTDAAGADQSADVTGISGDGYQTSSENTFDVQGKTMTIAGRIDSGKIPAHFSAKTITYNGNDIRAYKYDAGEVYLVYLTDEAGKGDFYVLDMQKNIVTSYISVGTEENPLVLLLPPDNANVSDSYGKTVFAVSETAGITAYQYNQPEDTLRSDAILGEYYYVYGMTLDGVARWYLYDNGGNTFVRSVTDLSVDLNAEDASDDAATVKDNSLDKMIIVGLGVLCVIFFVLMIVFAGKSRSARKYLPEETFDEDDEEEIMTRAERRREDRKYRHFMDDLPENDEEEAAAEKTEPVFKEIADDGEVYLDEDENGPAPADVTDFREESPSGETEDLSATKPMPLVKRFCETDTETEISQKETGMEQIPGKEIPSDEEDMASSDKEELEDLERMLMAGLQDALKEQEEEGSDEDLQEMVQDAVQEEDDAQKKQAGKEKTAASHHEKKHGKNQHGKKNGKDAWDDELEFLDL